MRPAFSDESRELAMEWRKLTRAATLVAVLTSPATLSYLMLQHDWPLLWALLVTFLSVIAFRGFVDVLAHRFIPRASLYGAEKPLLDEDVVARRRVWYWRTKWRRWTWIVGLGFGVLLVINAIHSASSGGRRSATRSRCSATCCHCCSCSSCRTYSCSRCCSSSTS